MLNAPKRPNEATVSTEPFPIINGKKSQPRKSRPSVPTTPAARPINQSSRVEPTTADSVFVTLSGSFSYYDHAVTPDGVDRTGKLRPIRKARVDVFVQSNGIWNVDDTTAYTDDTGKYQISTTASTGGTVLVRVCSIGPTDTRIQVTSTTDPIVQPYCLLTNESDAASTIDVGDTPAPDSRLGSAPWNIYDVAVDAWQYLQRHNLPPTNDLTLIWYPGFNPIFSGDVSYYILGRVNVNGTLANGDQWNDSVVAHEIGHWVMDHYAGFPPDYLFSSHFRCSNGKPGLQYSEGWANFFSSVSRTEASDPANRTYASWYIDAPDDDPVLGTTILGRINAQELTEGSAYDSIAKTLSPIFDTTESEDFRKGNFCEWQIASVLWNITQAPISHSFEDVVTAFRTKYDNHYPYNFNQWWYGWTNTLGNRNGPSLGSEAQLLDLFTKHKIQVGFYVDIHWNVATSTPYIGLWAWLPASIPFWINGSPPGDGAIFPFARYIDNANTGASAISITSPYAGKYVFAAVDGSPQWIPRFTPDVAQARVFDGSTPGYITINAPATRPEWYAVWYITDIVGDSGTITPVNRIAYPSDVPPY